MALLFILFFTQTPKNMMSLYIILCNYMYKSTAFFYGGAGLLFAQSSISKTNGRVTLTGTMYIGLLNVVNYLICDTATESRCIMGDIHVNNPCYDVNHGGNDLQANANQNSKNKCVLNAEHIIN